MINEEFDDEGSDETEEAEMQAAEDMEIEEFERQEAERSRPPGAWSKTFAGREVWLKPIPRAQLQGLRRFHQVMSAEIAEVTALPESEETEEEIVRIVRDFNDACFDLIDSLYLDDEDRRWVLRATVRGVLDPAEIMQILFPARDEPDDDAEPVKPAKVTKSARTSPKVSKSARTSPKTANASRTRR